MNIYNKAISALMRNKKKGISAEGGGYTHEMAKPSRGKRPFEKSELSCARSHREAGSRPCTKLDFIFQVMRKQLGILTSEVIDRIKL